MSKKYFELVLERHPAVADAARASGINRTDFYKRVKQLGIKLPLGSNRGHRGNWGALSD